MRWQIRALSSALHVIPKKIAVCMHYFNLVRQMRQVHKLFSVPKRKGLCIHADLFPTLTIGISLIIGDRW